MNYRTRINEDIIKNFSKLFKIIFLVGARQVGKSSLFAHLFPQYKAFVFDPIQDLFNVRKSPDLFLSDFKPPIVLDEIQFVPELLPALKRFVDASDVKGQYFITGSQRLSILKSVSESLAGRVVIIPVNPMTPHEMYSTFNKEQSWFLKYIKNPFTVFSIKELEDELRTIAMFMILDFIWTKIKKDLKKRLLIVDEAWYLMKHEDSAAFLYGLAKRARKYYLALTTITQDVEDFLNTNYGKAIVNNSSIQILMRQSPAAIIRSILATS